jgi:hypothetical protein
MKTKAVRVGELRIGQIIRVPVAQTLYHRVKMLELNPDSTVKIIVDGGRSIGMTIDEHLYVLEDEPAPIVLDGIALG